MKRQRRLAAFFFAALFLLAAVTSSFVIACEANHDCVGSDCAVCAVAAVCQNAVRILLVAAAAAACVAASGRFPLSSDPLSLKRACLKTPFSLKVKLSD